MIHRDLKPANILVTQIDGKAVPKLIDFGIAREFTPGVTQTHTSLISVGYAPIEQYLPHEKRTPATDVYGLAATLYALLTAQVPVASILRDRQPMPAPRELQPHLSAAVNQAVLQGMAVEVHHRPSTVADWLAMLPGRPLSGQPQADLSGEPDMVASLRSDPSPSALPTVAISPGYIAQPFNNPISRAETMAPSTEMAVSPQQRRARWVGIILGLAAIVGIATATIANLLSQPPGETPLESATPTASPDLQPVPAKMMEPKSPQPSPEPQPSASASPIPSPTPTPTESVTPAVAPPATPANVPTFSQDDSESSSEDRLPDRSDSDSDPDSDSQEPPRTLPNFLRREFEAEQRRKR
ncbi:MAG: protein kinase [Akkermansiaceae bacterium]|nr:protein kinase [Akkermansiaceae bacterium]